jgi:hypothetical protein
MGVFTKFRFFNRRLALSCVLIAVSTFNYGFDNQAFATTQAMDAFDKQFGVWNEKTGTYVLEPSWLSLFNSLNYIGFAAGKSMPRFYGALLMMCRCSRWNLDLFSMGSTMVYVRHERICSWHSDYRRHVFPP